MTQPTESLVDLKSALLALAQARGFDALGVSDLELDADAAASRPLARRGQARRDGLHGQTRHAPHATRRTGARHGAGAVGAHELLARRRSRRHRRSGRPGAGLCLAVCAGPRLSQGLAQCPAGTGRRHHRAHRADGLSGVRRLGAGAREGTGAQRRPRVDRQAHQSHRARCRLVLLHRRDPHRPAASHRRIRQRALRHLLGLHSRLPHGRDHRSVPAGCAALHFVSDHRTARRDSHRAASHAGQSHLRLRRLPARVPLEQIRARRRASGFQDAAQARCVATERSVRVDRSGVPGTHRRLGHPPHRL